MGLRTNPNVANKGLCFPHTTEQVEDQEHKPEHFVVPEGGGWGGGSGVSTLTKLPQPPLPNASLWTPDAGSSQQILRGLVLASDWRGADQVHRKQATSCELLSCGTTESNACST